MSSLNFLIDPEFEFEKAALGDLRLNARVVRIMRSLAASPADSLPHTFADPSQLEGMYRFLANSRASAYALLEAHRFKLLERAKQAGYVGVLHDSSAFEVPGAKRSNLGVIDPYAVTGFYAHFSLSISLDTGCPLGLGWMNLWTRNGKTQGKKPQQVSQYDPERESLRWNEAVHDSGADLLLAGVERVVHIMDREADCLELLADMCIHKQDFVIRGHVNRRLEPGREATQNKLFRLLENSEVIAYDEVKVIQHKITTHITQDAKKHDKTKSKAVKERGQRNTWTHERDVILELRAQPARFYASNGGHAHVPDEGIELNVVEVKENELLLEEGTQPLHWMLLTSLPINTEDDVKRIVDIYKKRWIIEEFHKALKTGCKFEEHQFDSGDTYAKMLVLYIPIALQMLQMRWMERHEPNAPASEVLNQDELDALIAHEAPRRKPLPAAATVKEVLLVVARLGGHLPHNGPPGWLILSRGFERLQQLTKGWTLAQEALQRSLPP